MTALGDSSFFAYPGETDPFDGLVLDEEFIRAAATREAPARTRLLAAQWRAEESGVRQPVDQPRLRHYFAQAATQSLVLVAAASLVLFLVRT